ncbi:serine/threonine-protein kinase [Streptacidiphilus sp. N1-12]
MLTQEWELGEPLDADTGGFGRVYHVRSAAGEPAVAKLIPKKPGADRELLFDGAGKRNVVPILDSGEHGDSWVIVMPRADKSLRGHLNENGGTLPLDECVQIMMDIAVALADLDGDIVHRDLKPENVLLLDGTWCLADFGLARYADAATATQTWKHHGTVAYYPPERWRMERATIASDVYALGTIGYEMFAGTTPFTGPEVSDFQRQHLSEAVPRLSAAPAPFAALIGECLYRAPQARPTPGNIVARLETMVRVPLAGGLAALAQANHGEVTRQAGVQRQQSQQRTEEERRAGLVEAAVDSLALISETVLEALKGAASAGEARPGQKGGWIFTLGKAQLALSAAHPVSAQAWTGGMAVPFDVVAHATMALRLSSDYRGYRGRSHSLWFCDARTAGEYGWFETAFMTSPFLASGHTDIEPFGLAPGAEARSAVSPGMDVKQLAWPFTRLEIADLDDFISRWANWLAAAAAGQLSFPSTMPERSPHGSHR